MDGRLPPLQEAALQEIHALETRYRPAVGVFFEGRRLGVYRIAIAIYTPPGVEFWSEWVDLTRKYAGVIVVERFIFESGSFQIVAKLESLH